MLVQVEGTPLATGRTLDPLEFVRTIAVARITMPKSVVRLSAGREDMSEETQALCFLAGANSIFYGPKLLTTPNPERDRDMRAARQARPAGDGAMTGFLLVFLGGGIGAALRHGVNILAPRLLGAGFPYATIIENVSGSLAMGLLAG